MKKKLTSLTKSELAENLYRKIGFSKQDSREIVDVFIAEIKSTLIDSKTLKLASFGTFKVLSKKARIGRNPKTKEPKMISERDVVSFCASNQLRARINRKKNGK